MNRTDELEISASEIKKAAVSGNAERIFLLGVQIHLLTVEHLLAMINNMVRNNQRTTIAHVNAHAMNIAYSSPWFRDFLNTSEIVFCDGAGVILGARIMGHVIPKRITYADWMWQLAAFAEQQKLTMFFLGGREGIAEKAALRLCERFPDLLIVGTHHGYFHKTPGHPENEAVIQMINQVQPDILLVGFGMPLQEHWLMQNRSRIDAKIASTGGAVFDYVSGELRRGPRWMTDSGFEWLARLFIEPSRLWQRYLIGNPLFLWRVLKQRFRFATYI